MITTSTFRVIFICLLILISTRSISLAQKPRMAGERPSPEVRERLAMVKKWKMTEALDIGEEQANTFFPRLNSLEKLRTRHVEERREIFVRLKMVLDRQAGEEAVKEKDLQSLLDEFSTKEEKFTSELKAAQESVMEVLTMEQRAKYVIFEDMFQREILDILSKRKPVGRPMRD